MVDSKKKKYIFFLSATEIAGAQRFQLDYLKFIDYEKYSVVCAVDQDKLSVYFEQNHLPVQVVTFPKVAEQDGVLKKFFKYFNFLKRMRPDAVIFHQFCLETFSWPELLAAYILTKGNVYMILHSFPVAYPKQSGSSYCGIVPRIDFPRLKLQINRRLLACFTKYSIAVSQALKNCLVTTCGFPQHKVQCSYHGVDIAKFSPSLEGRSRWRKAAGIEDTDILIVSTARFSPRKNIDRLVRAFDILAQDKKDVQLILVGEGRTYPDVLKVVNAFETDIQRRIKFLGFQENVAAILQACDIFVLPSDTEGLPLACLEAMACGLICVVTDCGGEGEIVRDGWNGFLVEKSPEGVLEGLRRALNLKEEKSLMLHNAREFIEENFNLEKNIQSGLKLLQMK